MSSIKTPHVISQYITIFVMRDFKALYYLLDYPKLLNCFDRDLDKIEIKSTKGFEKSRFKGKID